MKTILAILGAVFLAAPMATQVTPAATTSVFHAQVKCPTQPAARGYAATAYDWTRGTVFLIGGIDNITPDLDYPLFDVWSYNTFTHRWTLRLQSDRSNYNAFQRDAIALDPRSRKVVLYSTFVDPSGGLGWGVETWIYDIRRNAFENVTSGTEPSLRWGSRMVYDAQSRRAILFGGSNGFTGETLNETWAFDFETKMWTRMEPAVSPPPHHFAAMAYHPLADRVVLFGGYDIYPNVVRNDTWTYDYDMNTWTELHPNVSPPARLYHAMAWDITSNRIIMFGGDLTSDADIYQPVAGDTWSLDLKRNKWTQLAPTAAPSARAWHIMEGTWGGVLLFGGSPTHSPFTNDDTWIFNSHGNRWGGVDFVGGSCPAF